MNRPQSQPGPGDFPYFRNLWNTVVASLLAAAFVPLLLLGGVLYFYSAAALEDQAIETLEAKVAAHRTAIDQFLEDRIRELRMISRLETSAALAAPGALEEAFRALQADLPCYTDIGVIDAAGAHLAYVGPYDLIDKNYLDAPWFGEVMRKGDFISDVYLGHRNEPHAIIAVKARDDRGWWILRATINADYFNALVTDPGQARKTDGYLVNGEGIFQSRPLSAGELMGQSPLSGLQPFEGVRVREAGEDILAYVWQTAVPWLNVVHVKRGSVFGALQRVKTVGILVFILGALLIVPTVLLVSNHLILRLETKRRDLRFLDHQLQHASKLASVTRLAQGQLLDLKDQLVNLHSACQWAGELSRRPSLSADDRQEVQAILNQVKEMLRHAAGTVDRCLDLAKPPEVPLPLDVNLNQLLDDLVTLLSRELHLNRIRITRRYQNPLPPVRCEPTALRQVFQNLLLNALTAIGADGDIELSTSVDEGSVKATISDSGPGIPEHLLPKIFDPLFTTNPVGIGLGLTICRRILEEMGGTISARNETGQGAAFEVVLPLSPGPAGA